MWHWLKRWLGDLWRRWRRQPVVQRTVPVVRSDEEYLLLLTDLLERLAIKQDYGTLEAWEILRGVKERELAVWLRGAAGRIDEDLRARLGWLAGLRRGDLAIVAEEIWRADSAVVPESQQNNIDISSDDAGMWFDRGNSLFFEGRYEEAIASYDRAVAIKPDKYD